MKDTAKSIRDSVFDELITRGWLGRQTPGDHSVDYFADVFGHESDPDGVLHANDRPDRSPDSVFDQAFSMGSDRADSQRENERAERDLGIDR